MTQEVEHVQGIAQSLTVGDGISSGNAAWSFGGDTAKHFEQHVSRSVPYYKEGHELVLSLSDFFIKHNSVAYELGCSTGALTRRLARKHPPTVRWIGLDVEDNMIAQAKHYVKEEKDLAVDYIVSDILAHEYEKSDFMISYYTIQFIPPHIRQEIFNLIYETLHWGGGFVLFEKVRAPDARFQDISNSLYIDYKLENGYSPDEIISKSKSLKGVLEPFSTAGNLELMKRAGFKDITTIFKHVCFEGFLCIK